MSVSGTLSKKSPLILVCLAFMFKNGNSFDAFHVYRIRALPPRRHSLKGLGAFT